MDMRGAKVNCFYYGLPGNISHIPAWRHLQTFSQQLKAGDLRLDGEWYRRVIKSESGETIPVLAIWNPETDITTFIVGSEFRSEAALSEQIHSSVLPEQLHAEEWSN